MSQGVRGLWLVVPIAAVLAVGAGGPESSLLVLGPVITYALPLIVMVAFWWEDWPGTRLAPKRAGWVDTALIAAGAVALAWLGRAITGGPAFPRSLPLGAAVFGVMLELTLVGEGRPLRRLPALAAGPAALAVSWALGLALYFALVRDGTVAGADFGAFVVCVGAWQVLCFVVWDGIAIASRTVRPACAHALVLGGGVATCLGLRAAMSAATVTAVGGCFIAGGLVSGMLFEVAAHRFTTALLVGAGLFVALSALARMLPFGQASAEDWVAHATLNALAASTILHVAVGRRWPFAA